MPDVVLTRALPAGSPYHTVLAAHGLTAIAMPVTDTAPARDPDALARALERADHAGIVVASARAADALARALRGRAPHELPPVWAVGPATLGALAAAGIHAEHPADAHDAASLARAVLAAHDLAGRRVLVPRAEHGRDEAIALLRDAGAEIDDVVAYRTVPVPADDPTISEGAARLRAGQAVACVVFAPSQAAALAAVVGPLAALAVPFAAIGDTTAAALREAGVATVVVAATPTPEGVANAIAAVYPPRS